MHKPSELQIKRGTRDTNVKSSMEGKLPELTDHSKLDGLNQSNMQYIKEFVRSQSNIRPRIRGNDQVIVASLLDD